MELAVSRSLDPAQQERIRGVCATCDQFLPDTFECRFVRRGGRWFLEVFQNRRCRPRQFLESFLRRRVSIHLHGDLEDVIQDLLLDLTTRPPNGFPSYDLVGLQRLLASRAIHIAVDHQRKIEGRIRCGNCAHHRVDSEQGRVCAHPEPQHPWTGHRVQASLDPRSFEPPCNRYVTRRERVAAVLNGIDPVDVLPDPGPGPDAAVTERERAEMLTDCLAAVQRTNPRAHFVILMAYFKHKTNEEIAGALNSTVRTVTRYKDRALSLLREEMEFRGISGALDFE